MNEENFMKDLFHPSSGFQLLTGELIAKGVSEFGDIKKLSNVAYRVSQAARAIVAEALPEGREPTQLHQAIISCIILGTMLESAVSTPAAVLVTVPIPYEKEA